MLLLALSLSSSASGLLARGSAHALPVVWLPRRVPPTRCSAEPAKDPFEGNEGIKETVQETNYVPYMNYLDGDRPAASWTLASNNFAKQGWSGLTQLLENVGLQQRDRVRPPACLGFKLSNEAVTEAERLRELANGRVDASPVSRALYDLGCLLLDNLFDERPIQVRRGSTADLPAAPRPRPTLALRPTAAPARAARSASGSSR